MFRRIRIFLLLFLLAFVGVNAWQMKTRSVEWKAPLLVVIYPINADGSETSKTYIDSLSKNSFDAIETFYTTEAARYGITASWGAPVQISLAPQVHAQPPMPPRNGGIPSIMWWSLKLRYWAWRNDTHTGIRPQVKMFVRYYDPATHDALAHSLGLEKGLVGVVNAFATRRMAGSNNVIIAHELAHTLGATDKYERGTNLPRLPDGYAAPQSDPLYPQERAELMGGRIPISESKAMIPEGLHQVVVGPVTAREINWTR